MIIVALATGGSEARFRLALSPALVGLNFQAFWYFQGRERLGSVAYYAFATKFIYVALIFILVKDSDDLLWVAVAYS